MKKILFTFLLSASATLSLSAQTVYELPPLPYPVNALEPVMSTETIEYHHGKHVQAYVDNLNKLIPGTPFADATLELITQKATGSIFNNGAQILNHRIFFESFAPELKARHTPQGALAEAINRDFGSFDNFKKQFAESATALFGSGWTWLAKDADGKLYILSMEDAGNPLRQGYSPLLGFDVWEHSYYIDYRNKRGEYIENLWKIVDWGVIEERYDNMMTL